MGDVNWKRRIRNGSIPRRYDDDSKEKIKIHEVDRNFSSEIFSKVLFDSLFIFPYSLYTRLKDKK